MTEKACTWNVPKQKPLEMIPLEEMGFKTKSTPSPLNKTLCKGLKELKPFTQLEIFNMMSKIDAKKKTCALFTLIKPFNEKYKNPTELVSEMELELLANQPSTENLNESGIYNLDSSEVEGEMEIVNSEFLILTNMFREVYAAMDLDYLVKYCAVIDLKFKEEDIQTIEMATKNQSSSTWWFQFRAGRITASNLKSVCRTSIKRPARTVVSKICYPELTKFSSKATEYGKRNEDIAFSQYNDEMVLVHDNFVLQKSGLHLNNNYPGFGASPDGVSVCDCHGKIVLEIKCPYSGRNGSIEDVLALKDPYIKQITNESNEQEYIMVEKHAYYYQVQMLIFMTESTLAHFVVWTPSGLKLLTIEPNLEFWLQNYATAEMFLRKIILPEILGKIYTRKIFINEK